jgi:thiol-disulfide isomerase/thioredoxin
MIAQTDHIETYNAVTYMKNSIITALFCSFLTLSSWAQSTAISPEGFSISGQIKGNRDSTLVLAHWYGKNTFIPKDTAKVDSQGKLVFSGKNALPEGLYLIVAPLNRDIGLHLILTDDQQFSFATDTASLVKHMHITGSAENELFYAYQQQLSQLSDQAQSLTNQKKVRTDAASTAPFTQQMKELQKKATDSRTKFLTDHASTFTVKLLRASAEPDVSLAPKAANGRPDSVWVFNYFKSHFWDDFDFSDERLIRTPFLQSKLDRYLKELTVQLADSLIKEADFVVNKAIAGKSKEVKSYTIYYITSQYERPSVVGTEGLFVHMFETYYATGIMPVSDSSTLKSIGERVAAMKPNLAGKFFVNPVVSDTLGRPVTFKTIQSDYTVVFFYSPTCGHCRESAPKLAKFADEYKQKGVTVVAIAIDQDPKEWKKFVREFKLGNVLNGFDFAHRTDYRHQYDIFTTPTVYILDKNKKILAPKLPADNIEDFILFHKRQHSPSSTTKSSLNPLLKKA